MTPQHQVGTLLSQAAMPSAKAKMLKASAARPRRTQHRRSRGPTTPPEDRLRSVTKSTPFKLRKECTISLSSNMKLLSLAESPVSEITPARRLLLHTLSTQDRHQPNPSYMTRVQRDEIKGFMRYDVLEWILRINKKLEYHPETFAIAANLFDRLLSTVRVKPGHLQLIGGTCFLMAAKMHEVWNTHPSLVELTSAANHAFSGSDVERMEKQILLKLDWALNPPTPHLLVHQLLPLLSVPQQYHADLVAATEAVLERVVLCERFLQYSPSTLAACVTMHSIGYRVPGLSREVVEAEVLYHSQIPMEAFTRCCSDLDLLMLTWAPVL